MPKSIAHSSFIVISIRYNKLEGLSCRLCKLSQNNNGILLFHMLVFHHKMSIFKYLKIALIYDSNY